MPRLSAVFFGKNRPHSPHKWFNPSFSIAEPCTSRRPGAVLLGRRGWLKERCTSMQLPSRIVTALVVSGARLLGGAPVGAEDTVATGTTEVVAKADKAGKKKAGKKKGGKKKKKGAKKGKKNGANKGKKKGAASA